jgi:hypothetical protein
VQWLTPVIPATQEFEIRRTVTQGQPRQKVSKSLSQPVSWAWRRISGPSFVGDINRRVKVQAGLAKMETPFEKGKMHS